ncbi:sce7725 family protein [Aeromicrobium sp. JJY06]|uniref:sce7725 family protein n=1 Tax=Aeromicrobium sp. JJY06 TaxID=3373478 RepID=UPI00376F2FA8
MYMPRLRASQHELFAVRTCAKAFSARGTVTPVLEPVKKLDALTVRRINAIAEDGLRCALVLNPSVGLHSRAGDWRDVGRFYLDNGMLATHGIAVLSNSAAEHTEMSGWIESVRTKQNDLTLDVIHERDLSPTLRGNLYTDVRYNIAIDRSVPSSYGLPLSGLPVIWFDDPFPLVEKNAEFVGRGESIFSARVATFRSAGYAGVSDFLTIGGRYQKGGGPAYAVALHLTYQVGNDIRMRHFCSHTNDSQDDPAGKFFEALDKLVAFASEQTLPANPGLDEFRELHARRHFPGLGKAKEHSMVNHLSVMEAAIRR